jgi:hypothetical protein
MNRCQRCNRKLTDPNAVFGWRCAEILGVSETLSKMGAEIFRKFVDGVTKAKRLFGKSNFKFTDEQWKKMYSAFAKMSLWDGIDDKKVKEARKESYSVFEAIKDKGKDFVDELNEYKDYIEKHGLISGISIKLADDKKLDDVTNAVLKTHDFTVGNTSSGKRIKNVGANVYDTVHNAIAQKNYQYNKNVDLSSYKGGYINDQNNGQVSKLKLGSRTMDYNGCEVIAAYNSMLTLGDKRDIRDIAYHFENDGQMLGGEFGTNPYAIKRYFTQNGYKVKTLEGENITDKKIPDADSYILSFWNDKDIQNALHTVSMRKSKDGYELFNYDNPINNSSKEFESLTEKMKKKNNVPLVLHCIYKEDK